MMSSAAARTVYGDYEILAGKQCPNLATLSMSTCSCNTRHVLHLMLEPNIICIAWQTPDVTMLTVIIYLEHLLGQSLQF